MLCDHQPGQQTPCLSSVFHPGYAACAACAPGPFVLHPPPPASPPDRHLQSLGELSAAEQALRQQLAAGGEQFGVLYELATTLHRLDYMSPNGGQRVPEAVRLYK